MMIRVMSLLSFGSFQCLFTAMNFLCMYIDWEDRNEVLIFVILLNNSMGVHFYILADARHPV